MTAPAGRRPLNVLFAVAAWGLGHATRDLVLIRGLLEAGHRVTVLSTERALALLRGELGDRCRFVEVPDIPKPLSRWSPVFYVKMSLSMPKVFWTFWHEHRVTRQLHREHRFDRIVSDTRYGVFLNEVPSYLIVHSLRQIIPGRPRPLEWLVERSQMAMFAGARTVLVPDAEEDGLAGDLCHNLACRWDGRLEYLGILSSVRNLGSERDVDYFVSVSGAEPQRTIFEQIVLSQVHDLPGRAVVALGRPDTTASVSDDGRVRIHSFLDRRQQEEMLNRARLVVSRSGYTTLMELAEVGSRALFTPTHGQSEQEYLGAYHEGTGAAHCVRQADLDLPRDVKLAEGYHGLPRVAPTAESVRRFLEILES